MEKPQCFRSFPSREREKERSDNTSTSFKEGGGNKEYGQNHQVPYQFGKFLDRQVLDKVPSTPNINQYGEKNIGFLV
ncbi:MAG: hypothetical protein CR994_01160 [Maribacter sp.]|nr:MAG: hypothetical protein CR994_01160 [Maribacter sp.]